MEIRRIDLHMHSTASDGTDDPAALVQLVRQAGIPVFSVTNHDTVQACDQLMELTRDAGPVWVAGVELSCRDEEGKYHILGYGYDPKAEPLRRVIGELQACRLEKLQARLAFLRESLGIVFPAEETDALVRLPNPGKPHIAALLVRHGYADTVGEAIRRYLRQLPDIRRHVSPEEAIRAIRESGGIAALAHPVFGDGSQLISGGALAHRVRRLTGFGLQGLEGYYSGYDRAQRAQVLALAEALHLYVTAGSDYHGANKTVALGNTGLPDADAIPEGLTRFFEALGLDLPI